MFRNRLTKVYRHLSKVAARQAISAYRLYDADVPEAPFLIEKLGSHLYVAEYQRRFEASEEAQVAWRVGCAQIMSDVTGVPPGAVFFKMRRRKENRFDQYQKLDAQKTEFEVAENGLRFIVNLSDYLDTGLFLDHRLTRQMVQAQSHGKRVLNLFCYTGSFSVYAAAGGAQQVVSVDLSNTYIDWAERNMQLNFPQFQHTQFVQADVLQYIAEAAPQSFDLIVLDPPTFSNSKRMDDFFDVQRDHAKLINASLRLLSPGGLLYFSTNFTRFALDKNAIGAREIKDITKATTPFDFAGKLQRPCFQITR